jgi:hypothetical protein
MQQAIIKELANRARLDHEEGVDMYLRNAG